MKTDEQERPLDIDFDGVHAAMLRATVRAHEIAASTGTDIIQMVEGKVVRVKPDPLIREWLLHNVK
jgi:hypothetical protein